jgi:hypothetical protein
VSGKSGILAAMSQKLQIASPCSASWDRMVGDDRVRHCPDCNLNVYNFSAMSLREIDRIVADHEGRLCARFYRRADGTMLTQNCPVGIRAVVSRASRAAAAAFATILSVSPAMARSISPTQNSSLVQIEEQQKTGLILIVLDPSGAGISNAHVILSNKATRQSIDTHTDAKGQLRMPDLGAGEYDISVIVPGFSTRQGHASIPPNGMLTVQLEPVIATMGEVVEIKNSHPTLMSRLVSSLRHIF